VNLAKLELPALALPGRRRHRRLPPRLRPALAILGVSALVALAGPWLVSHEPNAQDLVNKLAAPSWEHPLGTDELGRDTLSRVVHAARLDIGVGLVGAVLPFLVGAVLGAMAGYWGGFVDALVMKASELIVTLPVYVLTIVLIAYLGTGVGAIVVAYTLVGWVPYARLIRATISRVKHEEYVDAARLGGVRSVSLLARHIVPNSYRESMGLLALDVMSVILVLASFSYLGLGSRPPDPEWGSMVAAAQPYLQQQWWLIVAPGVAIGFVGLGFVLLSEAVDDPNRLEVS